jgi:hypothetical protein
MLSTVASSRESEAGALVLLSAMKSDAVFDRE